MVYHVSNKQEVLEKTIICETLMHLYNQLIKFQKNIQIKNHNLIMRIINKTKQPHIIAQFKIIHQVELH